MGYSLLSQRLELAVDPDTSWVFAKIAQRRAVVVRAVLHQTESFVRLAEVVYPHYGVMIPR